MLIRDSEIDKIVRNTVDLHFHIGADVLPRKYTINDFIIEERHKIRGAALKSHSFPTIPGIKAIEKHILDEMIMVGSITLNYFMGGFNASAIYASAVMSKDYPIIVWFPTIHAENHLINSRSEYEIPPEWVKDPDFYSRPKTAVKAIRVTDWAGNLIRKAEQVLGMIKEMNCILATGHLSWQEADILTREALKMGITVIVTHPYQKDIAMPIEVQQSLGQLGAYIEYCYVMYLDRDNEEDYPLSEMVRNIRAIGIEHCILTSDAGQPKNPGASDSLKAFIKILAREGLTKNDFEQMMIVNPEHILGLRF